MPINLSMPKAVELKPRIVVIGVGGAGGNAVNNMISSGLDGVEFIVANTDAQALALSKADRRVQMGGGITQGLGAGMRPEVGEKSAEDSLEEILEHLDGAHMLFVAAGMGGGTGTGAAPVIAQAARERGILTVAIVTKPFQFEGSKRMRLAEEGVEKLYSSVDTLITIPNQNLFRVATESTTMSDAFAMADEVLHSGVRGVTDLMVVPGLINLDFADVRTVMDEMGKAMMGTGEATGERRAVEAAESAISNPLLDDVSLKGARGVLINITGGRDLTLYEVDEAASLIRGQVDQDANIIVGSALDDDLDGIVRVSVVATGVDSDGAFAAPHRDNFEADTAEYEEAVGAETAFDETESETMAPVVRRYQEPNTPAQPQHQSQPIASPQYAEPQPPQPQYTEPAYEAPKPYPPKIQPEPVATQAPAPAIPDAVTPEPQRVIRNTFGLFGRRKKASPPPAAPISRPQATERNTGDLFDANQDDELEIPSFLRRQNR